MSRTIRPDGPERDAIVSLGDAPIQMRSGLGELLEGADSTDSAAVAETVTRAAALLSERYGGADVLVHYYRSGDGGATWLKTTDETGLGANTDVGVNVTERDSGLLISALVSEAAAVDHRDHQQRADSVGEAVDYLAEQTGSGFGDLVARVDTWSAHDHETT